MARPKHTSRARAREALLKQCAAVRVPAACDVLVAGAGASGLVCAVEAARAGLSVVVCERSLEAGLPILATGNGRCNIANVSLGPAVYNDPVFVRGVFGTDNAAGSVRSFFSSLGLQFGREEDRLYPLSRSAGSVRDLLVAEASDYGCVFACARTVSHAKKTTGGWLVTLSPAFDGSEETILAKDFVIATGGGSELPSQLGLHTAPSEKILCALECRMGAFGSLAGKRLRATARIERNGKNIWQERGEVLVRERGLSGIVIYNASRHARTGDALVLDLLSGCDRESLEAHMTSRPLGPLSLAGVLDPDTSRVLYDMTGQTKDHAVLMNIASNLEFDIVGKMDTEFAQVTRGGVCTSEVEPTSLRAGKNLYVTGEALDVDGPCGGYNLGFAWASGLAAARAILLAR